MWRVPGIQRVRKLREGFPGTFPLGRLRDAFAMPARRLRGTIAVPDWRALPDTALPAVALCGALLAGFLVWNPQVHDLAAHVFRAELFERSGFAIWNGSWYAGHYTLTWSVLFAPLAALAGVQAVGAASALASAYLFDRLVRRQWGERAIWASLWFAVAAAAMYVNGNLAFALGTALGLASLGALQRGRPLVAALAAPACTLASPLAGAFLGGVALVVALVDPPGRRDALAVTAAAVLPALALNAVFHEEGIQPYDVWAWFPLPLWCAGAWYVTRNLPGERGLRIGLAGYALAATLFLAVESPMGSNVSRLGMFFGGPVLLAVLLAHREALIPRRAPRGERAATIVLAAATLAWGAYWQLDNAVREVATSLGDPSTERSYYEPLTEWLREHGGETARIEIPESANSWEMAYVAPDFQLARGWLRQMDRARNDLFYEGELTQDRYLGWLLESGVRYVALPDAEAQQYSREERELILSGPPYLRPRFAAEHWRVWEVLDAQPLVQSAGAGQARLVELEPDSFTLQVRRTGTFVVLVRASPFWSVAAGRGCVTSSGEWTAVRADAPGTLRVENRFSLGGALRSLVRNERGC